MNEIADYIAAFELLGDWDSRYLYLVELGQRLPPMPPHLKTEANRVKGCMSQVYVAALPDPADPRRLIYVGDCDTAIIKGVLALLIELLSHRTPEDIQALDLDALFEGLRLHEHLSPNRHFGIYAIVQLMKGQARGL